MATALIVATLAIAGFFGLVIVFIYNSLVGKKNQVENAFGGMDVQLKKRYDLIPNLVSTVKEFMEHEKSTLEEITRLRSAAINPSLSTEEKIQADNQISQTLGGLMVAVERYPELKSNENFLNLQRNLNEVESQISAARRTYNSSVTDFNNSVEMFPSNLIAGMMGYRRKEVFVIPDSERKNVDVGSMFKK